MISNFNGQLFMAGHVGMKPLRTQFPGAEQGLLQNNRFVWKTVILTTSGKDLYSIIKP